MTEILEVVSIDLDLTETDGTQHYIATVILDRAAVRFYGHNDPPEMIPGQVSGCFTIEPGETPPPLSGAFQEQASYLKGLDLDWMLDDQEDCGPDFD